MPLSAGTFLAARQRVTMPLYGPTLPLMGMADVAVDRTALYAGETVSRIDDIITAREAVARLTSP
jgi:hypothetical protein